MGLNLGAIAGGINQGWDMAQRDREINDQREARQKKQEWEEKTQAQQQVLWDEQNARIEELKRKRKADDALWSGRDPATKSSASLPSSLPTDAATGQAAVGQVSQQPAQTSADLPGIQAGVPGAQSAAGAPTQQAPAQPGQYTARINGFISRAELANRRLQEAIMSRDNDAYNAAQQELIGIQNEVALDNFNNLKRIGARMPDDKFVDVASNIVNSDSSPIHVDNFKQNGSGFTFTLRNKHTGAKMDLDVADRKELMEALEMHMDRAGFDASRKLAQEARANQVKELSKVRTLKPGEIAETTDISTGKTVRLGANDRPTAAEARLIYDADGNIVGSTGGRSGSAGGRQAKPADPRAAYMGEIEEAVKSSDTKYATPAEAADVRRIADTLAYTAGYDTTKLSPQVAHTVAQRTVQGTAKRNVGLNEKTWTMRQEIVDPEYGTFDIGPASQRPTKSDGADMTKKLLAKMPAQDAAALQAAAFDRSGPGGTSVLRQKIESDIRAQTEARVKEAIAKQPAAEAAIRANADAYLRNELQLLGRKLDTISTYMDPPKKVERPSIKQNVGGLPGNAKQSGYDAWIAAKRERDDLLSKAERMSPDYREAYLANRLPEVERRIKENENYMQR